MSVALGDFLGDGSLDIAVANKGSNTVSVFLNNGSGSFTLDTTLTVGSAPDAVAAGDLNNDGDDDLVVANSGDNNISVILSNGDGTFASAVNYAVGTGPTAVVLAAFTGSGILDVAVSNGGSNTVSVLMGNGDGTLGTATTYSVGSDPVALAVGSLDDDGVLDLTVSNHGSNNETVLANNGSGVFSVSQTIPLGESPDAVAVADFANSGVLDYVTDAPAGEGPEGKKEGDAAVAKDKPWTTQGVIALLKGTKIGDTALLALRDVKVYKVKDLYIVRSTKDEKGQWSAEEKVRMAGYTNILGKAIYLPSSVNDATAALTIVHELMHTTQKPATTVEQEIEAEVQAWTREAEYVIQFANLAYKAVRKMQLATLLEMKAAFDKMIPEEFRADSEKLTNDDVLATGGYRVLRAKVKAHVEKAYKDIIVRVRDGTIRFKNPNGEFNFRSPKPFLVEPTIVDWFPKK